ncbi:MAG: prepilin peptidase [Verrucomicrobiota bacterium]
MLIENFNFIQSQYPQVFMVTAFCFGAIVGSFLNVCIYRIPEGISVVYPGSRCGYCGASIPWYLNIPIFTWFFLRGKAACCEGTFSFRYAFVEILTGVAFLWAWLYYEPVVAIIGMVFAAILIATTFIDLDHMIIPLRFSVGGMLLGVILSFVFPQLHGMDAAVGLESHLKSGILSIVGVLVGSGTIYWIRLLAEIALKKEAMGEGDVMFMGCIGAFCGWEGGLFAIFGGSTIGTLLVVPIMLVQRLTQKRSVDSEEKDDDSLKIGMAVPFGPMLALGGWLYFAGLSPWVEAYLQTIVEIF